MKPILSIHNLSKKYFINEGRSGEQTFRESLSGIFKNNFFAKKEEFWALQDISFDVMPGESIGIIGKNGAGKSTLLKILSRITPPTKGEITVRGRIASLLEVGTGFHSELTGRENIFLNGSILGMKRSEIKNKFDEIVSFSGVEKFIDTPIKHYSSGMQLRLAFAVAAFLENEVLVIDEVLAVGDAEFQKKCLGKMEDVSKNEGRTVLFVSHNMEAVQNLCKSATLLVEGKMELHSDANTVIKKYFHSMQQAQLNQSWELNEAPGNKHLKWLSVCAYNSKGEKSFTFMNSEEIIFKFEFELNNLAHSNFDISFHLSDDNGVLVYAGSSAYTHSVNFENGKYQFDVSFPKNILNYGSYYLSRLMAIVDKKYIVHELNDAIYFEVLPSNDSYYGWKGAREGVLSLPNVNWIISKKTN